MDLKFIHSEENEIKRIKSTIEKIDWFRAQNYKLDFPAKIRDLSVSEITDDLIKEAVRAEYDERHYDEIAKKITSEWELVKFDFEKKLKSLGLPVSNNYIIFLTKYGVGGSYWLPHNVILNINSKKNLLSIILHEIIHLTIEDLIQQNKIEHWTKERLVDLIYRKFFPESDYLQRDPERAEEVKNAFEKYFPNIIKIITSLQHSNTQV